jgi:hypothetical protein
MEASMSEHPDGPEPVATGDRRDEVHFERRANDQLRMRATFPVDGPLPRELTPEAAAEGEPAPDLPTDVAAPKDGPSAWDARPPGDGDGSSDL